MLFGMAFLIVAVADIVRLSVMNSELAEWQVCFKNAAKRNQINHEEQEHAINQCNDLVSWFPVFYSIFNSVTMFYYLSILIFKKGEDYIAKYS